MGGRLFTDKLVCGRLKVLGVWSLDSATPFPSAYPAHASGSPTFSRDKGEQITIFLNTIRLCGLTEAG